MFVEIIERFDFTLDRRSIGVCLAYIETTTLSVRRDVDDVRSAGILESSLGTDDFLTVLTTSNDLFQNGLKPGLRQEVLAEAKVLYAA